MLYTVNWEIFAVKKFSRLSVTAKISHTKSFIQRNIVAVFLIPEVCCLPQYHPRRLLQQIEKWKKPSVLHLVGNLGHTGSTVLTVRDEIGKYACHHSVTAPVAAPRFRDKHGSHECTSLFHTPPRFLHVLNFWPMAHAAKILLCEIFSREPFIRGNLPIYGNYHSLTCFIKCCIDRSCPHVDIVNL